MITKPNIRGKHDLDSLPPSAGHCIHPLARGGEVCGSPAQTFLEDRAGVGLDVTDVSVPENLVGKYHWLSRVFIFIFKLLNYDKTNTTYFAI